jgi:hypothetical protein
LTVRGITISYGSAVLLTDPPSADDYKVRIYRTRDGRRFMGTDTYDLGHVCDLQCADVALGASGPWEPSDDEYAPDAYVGPEELRTDGTGTGQYATADIGPADYGDDTYVLCDACGHELYRDDDAHFDMYGTRLPGDDDDGADCTRHGAPDCPDPDCIRERGGSVLAAELRQAERWAT